MAQRIKVSLQFEWDVPAGTPRPTPSDIAEMKAHMQSLDYGPVKEKLRSLGLDIADQVGTVVVMQEDFR